MCIRDSVHGIMSSIAEFYSRNLATEVTKGLSQKVAQGGTCLLYTSDAADERSSVDLGGRRIIQKKTYVSASLRDISHRAGTQC